MKEKIADHSLGEESPRITLCQRMRRTFVDERIERFTLGRRDWITESGFRGPGWVWDILSVAYKVLHGILI